MPQTCRICTHHQREAIDSLLLDGWPSLREIGAQYRVSKDSLYRHLRAHVTDGEETPDGASSDNEARQDAGNSPPEKDDISPVKKSDDEQGADDEERYAAFIERWRGRSGIKPEEIASWPEGMELLQVAIERGDLCDGIGGRYWATVRQMSKFFGV